jgi:hypothetical protein
MLPPLWLFVRPQSGQSPSHIVRGFHNIGHNDPSHCESGGYPHNPSGSDGAIVGFAWSFFARASHEKVTVGLPPLDPVKLSENPVNLRFAQCKEKKQGGAFDAPFNLLARSLIVRRFLAWAGDRLFRRVTQNAHFQSSARSQLVLRLQIAARLCGRHSALLPPVKTLRAVEWNNQRTARGLGILRSIFQVTRTLSLEPKTCALQPEPSRASLSLCRSSFSVHGGWQCVRFHCLSKVMASPSLRPNRTSQHAARKVELCPPAPEMAGGSLVR